MWCEGRERWGLMIDDLERKCCLLFALDSRGYPVALESLGQCYVFQIVSWMHTNDAEYQ